MREKLFRFMRVVRPRQKRRLTLYKAFQLGFGLPFSSVRPVCHSPCTSVSGRYLGWA